MTIHYVPTISAAEIADAARSRLHFRKQTGFYRDTVKRMLDLAGVAILALPALVLLVLTAAVVALDGKSPIYRQERVGRNGKIFYLWKIRSMVPDADQKLEAYLASNPEARAEWDHHQKLKHDPRITRVGRIIRKTSLDELPQLLNVLAGDMSLVGPRPMMRNQRELYPGHAYYEVRPGITGFWQVSDRNETSFAERALFDTRYYNQMSLLTDLVIMIRTIGVVLNPTGH